MLHVVSILLLVLVAWCLLGVATALVLGGWLRRARNAPVAPPMQRTRAAWHTIARLVVLPSLIESTAREQKRRRQRLG